MIANKLNKMKKKIVKQFAEFLHKLQRNIVFFYINTLTKIIFKGIFSDATCINKCMFKKNGNFELKINSFFTRIACKYTFLHTFSHFLIGAHRPASNETQFVEI